MEVIVKTFKCCHILHIYLHAYLSQNFSYNRPIQSIGIPYLNMGFHVETLNNCFVHESFPIVKCP